MAEINSMVQKLTPPNIEYPKVIDIIAGWATMERTISNMDMGEQV